MRPNLSQICVNPGFSVGCKPGCAFEIGQETCESYGLDLSAGCTVRQFRQQRRAARGTLRNCCERVHLGPPMLCVCPSFVARRRSVDQAGTSGAGCG